MNLWSRRSTLWITLGLNALFACAQDEQALTQLILVADTDIVDAARIRFTVSGPAGRADSVAAEAAHAPGSGPSYVSLVHDDGALTPVVVTADALRSDGSVKLSRSHEVSFVPGQTRMVLLHLFASCLEPKRPNCKPDAQTCAEAGCVKRKLDDADLPVWPGSAPWLAADAGAPSRDGAAAAPDASVPEAGVPSIMACGSAGQVDTQSDVQHCGGCDTVCRQDLPENFHALSLCVSGSCKYACNEGWASCDDKTDNGCEADLSRPDRCGSCSNRCEKGFACLSGVCVKP